MAIRSEMQEKGIKQQKANPPLQVVCKGGFVSALKPPNNQRLFSINVLRRYIMTFKLVGGMDGTRTRDPLRDRQVF